MSRNPRWDASAINDGASCAGDVHSALLAFNASVMSMSLLDPTTTELVRLRCARSHHCRLCMATRSVASIHDGISNALVDGIDFYEDSDLDKRYKIALRITDALIASTGALDGELAAQARREFSEAELAELCLYVIKFSTQKIGVALGTDGTDAVPTDADGVTYVAYNADGTLKGFAADFAALA